MDVSVGPIGPHRSPADTVENSTYTEGDVLKHR